MQKTKKVILAVAVIMSCSALSATSQIYVKVRPPRPPVVRVVAPSPRHVWIQEDWHESNGRYESRGGRWEAPPARGQRYHKGYWERGRRGHRWHDGGWRR